jgi:crossover junction endodeoxyribonuclease RuvC
MIIFGIDPGTARMGYGIVDASKRKPKLIESDVIITHKDLDMHKRLLLLYNRLNEIAKSHRPDVMVIERLFFNTNVKTAMSVGQARGVSMLTAAYNKMPVYEYTALQAKLILTGYGRSDKKIVQDAVRKQLKLPKEVKSDDANDAVAMALCFIKKDLDEHLRVIEFKPKKSDEDVEVIIKVGASGQVKTKTSKRKTSSISTKKVSTKKRSTKTAKSKVGSKSKVKKITSIKNGTARQKPKTLPKKKK